MAADKILAGYEQSIGAKIMAIVDHYGPTSYSLTTFDVYPASNLNRGGFDWVQASNSFSGNYTVAVRYPTGYQGNGVPSVTLRWFYAPTLSGVIDVTIASAGTGQTNGTYTATSTGGGGTGAVIQYVIAGGVLTSAIVINPGSGYTSVPTFTIAAGGTPGTVTATIGVVSDFPVAAGTNLSAEAVRIQAIIY